MSITSLEYLHQWKIVVYCYRLNPTAVADKPPHQPGTATMLLFALAALFPISILFATKFMMAEKQWYTLSNVLNELAADQDSEDYFDGDLTDSEVALNLHGGDVGCVDDFQALLTRVNAVTERDKANAGSKHQAS